MSTARVCRARGAVKPLDVALLSSRVLHLNKLSKAQEKDYSSSRTLLSRRLSVAQRASSDLVSPVSNNAAQAFVSGEHVMLLLKQQNTGTRDCGFTVSALLHLKKPLKRRKHLRSVRQVYRSLQPPDYFGRDCFLQQ